MSRLECRALQQLLPTLGRAACRKRLLEVGRKLVKATAKSADKREREREREREDVTQGEREGGREGGREVQQSARPERRPTSVAEAYCSFWPAAE